MDIVVAFLVVGVLNLIAAKQIRDRLPREEASFLSKVFGWTLALRYALALFLYSNLDERSIMGLSSFAYTFWGDSSTYDLGGYLLAQSWSGEVFANPYLTRGVGAGAGFTYFVAFLYYLFGRNQLLVQLVNGTIGAVTALVIYAIARRLFDAATARWAALFMAFFPQMVFWSAAMYKDPAVMLCIAVSMYAVLRLQDRVAPRHLALFLLACLPLLSLRFYIFYIVSFTTLGTFLFGQRGRGLIGSVLTQLLLVGVFVLAFSFAAQRETIERQAEYFDLRQVQVARADQANLGRSAIGSDVDVSTPAGALAALPTGLVYLLLAPFPWSVSGLRQVLTVPEMLVWYSLMPAFIRGLRYTIRHRLRSALPILAFAGALTVAYAIFQGNVGTAYRQRTQVTMFFFIFMGVGLVQRRQARERARPTSGCTPLR
jgi:4-amino-4-deoxy-L-arabinose transferase-like glycosyltransferase